MTEAVFDYAAIGAALKQSRGEEPSGRRFQKGATGAYILMPPGHDYGGFGARCTLCDLTREEIIDYGVTNCSGHWPKPGDVIAEGSHDLLVYLPDGQRFSISKRHDVAAQWRQVKRLLAGEPQTHRGQVITVSNPPEDSLVYQQFIGTDEERNRMAVDAQRVALERAADEQIRMGQVWGQDLDTADPIRLGIKLFQTAESLYHADGQGGMAATKRKPRRRPS